MRKISICVLMCVIMLAGFVGCGGEKEVKPVLKGISFVAKITYYNEQYECDTQIDNNGKMTICVNDPDDLKGLKLTFSSEKIIAEYLGLTYTPKIDKMPFGNITKMIYLTLENISKENLGAKSKESNCVIKGECQNREYEFEFSPSGLPLSLKIPNENFKIEFCDVNVL